MHTKTANVIRIFDETALCILGDVNQAFYDRCSTSGHVDRTDPGVVLDTTYFFKPNPFTCMDINTPLGVIISLRIYLMCLNLQILFGFTV